MSQHRTNPRSHRVRAAADHLARTLRPPDDRGMIYGIVRSIDPLSVEVTNSRRLLRTDDIQFGQHARAYDRDVGIAPGDTLILAPMPDGDHFAVDVYNTDQEPE